MKMGGLMTMALENNYKALKERELRDLINQHDKDAEEEFTRRVLSGEIRREKYTLGEWEDFFMKRKNDRQN